MPLYAAPSAQCAPAVPRTVFFPPGKFLILPEEEYRNEKSFRPCPLISRFCCFPGTVKTVPYKAKMDAGAHCAPQRVDKVATLRKNASIFSGSCTVLPALATLAQSAP